MFKVNPQAFPIKNVPVDASSGSLQNPVKSTSTTNSGMTCQLSEVTLTVKQRAAAINARAPAGHGVSVAPVNAEKKAVLAFSYTAKAAGEVNPSKRDDQLHVKGQITAINARSIPGYTSLPKTKLPISQKPAFATLRHAALIERSAGSAPPKPPRTSWINQSIESAQSMSKMAANTDVEEPLYAVIDKRSRDRIQTAEMSGTEIAEQALSSEWWHPASNIANRVNSEETEANIGADATAAAQSDAVEAYLKRERKDAPDTAKSNVDEKSYNDGQDVAGKSKKALSRNFFGKFKASKHRYPRTISSPIVDETFKMTGEQATNFKSAAKDVIGDTPANKKSAVSKFFKPFRTILRGAGVLPRKVSGPAVDIAKR
jgi:hypothetical protein